MLLELVVSHPLAALCALFDVFVFYDRIYPFWNDDTLILELDLVFNILENLWVPVHFLNVDSFLHFPKSLFVQLCLKRLFIVSLVLLFLQLRIILLYSRHFFQLRCCQTHLIHSESWLSSVVKAAFFVRSYRIDRTGKSGLFLVHSWGKVHQRASSNELILHFTQYW